MADSAATSRHMAETIRKYNDAKRQSQEQFSALTAAGYATPQGGMSSNLGATTTWGDYKGIDGAEEAFQSNSLVRAAATVSDISDYVTYGATKAVEGIVDAVVGLAGWVGTWFGADNNWAEDFIKFDAAKWCTENIKQNIDVFDVGSKLITGHTLSNYSYINDADEAVKNGFRGTAEVVGELVPSVVAAIFTGGGSAAVQAASAVGLAAANAASTMGQTLETDVNEGNDLNASMGHAAIKGGISFGVSLVAGRVGGAAGKGIQKVGAKVGEKVGQKLGSKTAEVVASKATSILIKAGVDGTRQAAMVAADPLIKQITIDGQAIEKAYGSSEAIANTMSNIGQAFAIGALTSAASQTVMEGVDLARRGKSGYMAKYEQDCLDREQQALSKEIQKASKATKGMSQEEAKAYIEKRLPDWQSRMEKIQSRAANVAENLQGVLDATNNPKSTAVSKIGEKPSFGRSEDTFQRYVSSAKRQDMINLITKSADAAVNGRNVDFEAGSSFTMTSPSGGVYEGDGVKANVIMIGKKIAVSAPSLSEKSVANALEVYGKTPANGGIVLSEKTPQIQTENKNVDLNEDAPLTITEGGIENAKGEGYTVEELAKAMSEVKDAQAFFKAEDGSVKAVIKREDGGADVITLKIGSSSNSIVNVEPYEEDELPKLRSIAMSRPDAVVVENLITPVEDSAEGRDLIKKAAEGKQGKVYSYRAASDAVNRAFDYLEHELPSLAEKGESFVLSRSGKGKVERVLFKSLNGKELNKAISNAVDDIMGMTLTYTRDEGGKPVTVKGAIGEILDAGITADIRKDLSSALAEVAAARGKPSMMSKAVAKYESIISGLVSELRKQKEYIPLAQKLTKAHDRAKDVNDGFTAIPTNEDSLRANAERSMLFPFSQGGVVKNGKLQLKPFVTAIRQLSDHYDANHYGELYNMGVSLMLDAIRQWDAKGEATPQQERVALKLYEDIRKTSVDDARKSELDRIKSVSSSEYGMNVLGLEKDMGPIVQTLFKAVSMAMDNRATLDLIFSQTTEMGDSFVNGLSKAAGLERNFKLECEAKIAEIQEELGLSKAMKPVMVAGNEMAYLDALEWRVSLMMGDDSQNCKDAKAGFSYKSKKKGKEILIKYSDQVQSDLESAIPDELAEKAKDLVLNGFYGGLIYDKMAEIYKASTNRDLGELLPRGEYMRLVVKNMRASLMAPTVKGGTSTSNLIQRKGTTLPLKSGGGIFKKAMSVANMVAYEAHMLPELTKLDAQLNTIMDDGKTLFDHLPTVEQDFVRWTFKVYKGEITPEPQGFLGVAFVANALFNPKNPLIQPLSGFISGLSPTELLNPKLSLAAAHPTGKYKAALENLYKAVPEAKNRNANGGAVYSGNVTDTKDNTAMNAVKALTKFAAKANLSKVTDPATVNYIMLSVMNSAAKELGFEIDDPRVAEYVEKRARATYMTQISNNAKHNSPIQMVDNPYGKTTAAQSVLMRWGRAFGGARKAATNFFANNLLKLHRMSKIGKYLKTANPASFDDEISEKESRIATINEKIKEIESAIEEAKAERIALRDARTKDPVLTAEWELAKEDARQKKNYLEEVSKEKGREEDVRAASEAYEEAKAKAKSLKSGFDPEDQKAYEEAKAKEDELKKQKRGYEKSKRDAENDKASAEGRKSSYERMKGEYEDYIKHGGARRVLTTLVAGALMAGLSKTFLDEVFKLIRNQKSITDMRADELLAATFLNSTANLLPVLSNIAGFFQGQDSSDPTTQAISSVTDLVRNAVNFCQDQSEANLKSLVRSVAQVGSMVSGVPLYTVYTYIRDISSHFSPETAIAMNSVFYPFSSSKAHKNYSDAVNAKDERKAIAYFKQIMREEKAGEVSDKLAKESYSLSLEGNYVMPSSTPTQYTNDKGEIIKLTTAQEEAAKAVYSKANAVVTKMISSSQYRNLTGSAKGKAIKQVYDAYYEAAKAKTVTDYEPSSKIGKIVSSTSIDVSRLSPHIQHIKEIEATKTKTKRELAVAYLNRTSLSKQERLLVLLLCGYSLNDDSQASVASYLTSRGMSRKEAKEIVGIK